METGQLKATQNKTLKICRCSSHLNPREATISVLPAQNRFIPTSHDRSRNKSQESRNHPYRSFARSCQSQMKSLIQEIDYLRKSKQQDMHAQASENEIDAKDALCRLRETSNASKKLATHARKTGSAYKNPWPMQGPKTRNTRKSSFRSAGNKPAPPQSAAGSLQEAR